MGLKSLRDYLLNWRTARLEDRLIDDKPPQPVILMGADDGADGVPSIVNAAGEVTEASAAGIEADTNIISVNVAAMLTRLTNADPLMSSAAGAAVSGTALVPWIPILPITVTADGAGNPPATVIVPISGAGEVIDVMIWMTVDTVAGANQYEFDFRTDPLAATAIAPVIPNWTDIIIPLPVNGTTPSNVYGHRMITTVAVMTYGIAEGINGDWPNNANVTFTGFYRYI